TFTCPYCEHKIEASEVRDGEVLTCTNPLCQRQFQAELPHVTPDPELVIAGDARTFKPAPPTVASHGNHAATTDRPAVAAKTEVSATGTTVAAAEVPEVVAMYQGSMFARHPGRFLLNFALFVIGLAGLMWAWLLGSMLIFAISLLPLLYGLVRQI